MHNSFNSRTWAIAFSTAVGLNSNMALAGPYTDALTRCVVSSASQADMAQMQKYLFVVVSQHPSFQDLPAIPEETKEKVNKAQAELIERLLFNSCKNETTLAIKNEPDLFLKQPFEVLGRMSYRSLATDPAVSKALEGTQKYLNEKKWKEVIEDLQSSKLK